MRLVNDHKLPVLEDLHLIWRETLLESLQLLEQISLLLLRFVLLGTLEDKLDQSILMIAGLHVLRTLPVLFGHLRLWLGKAFVNLL